jgi:RNA polymerase-interacting CarD/CdnL/TRCF family regulator
MTRYIVKLSEQEELALRQLATQQGFEVIFKLLQGESLDAQTKAMECEDTDEKKRLLVLMEAQTTARIVSNLTRKLANYQNALQPTPEEHGHLDIIENVWDTPERTN